ncbi:ABC transporter substrate-binding protein [Streptomyces sp. NPDC001941]|uniref:ABC transporter substrate-binding protein n=1 Tax=Streptomyces sp. NPDC001941 TaxID=3154659 RepID=UPI00332B0673
MTGWRSSSFPLLAAAVTTACALLLTGCGVLPGTTGGSREPLTVMTWAPDGTKGTNMPGMPAMAQAYARWVNSAGGIGGRELRVLTCNEHNDSAGASACARRAAKEGVVAVVGSYSQYGRTFMPPLEAAGIPYIGGYGLSAEEFSSYLSYPVNGGQAALLAGNGVQLAGSCERVALVRPDTTGGDQLPALLDAGLARGNGDRSRDIKAPDDASGYGQQAAQARDYAAGKGRGCVTAALGERTENFFDSFQRLPGTGTAAYRDVRVSSVLGSVDQPLLDRSGGAESPFEGALVTGWYPASDDARWNAMRKVLSEHAFGDNRIDPADAGVQTTWIAFTVFRAAVESLGDQRVTATRVAGALDRDVRVDTGGLTPSLRWRPSDLLGRPGQLRVVNSDVTFQVVRRGKLVAQRDDFVDVARTMRAARS